MVSPEGPVSKLDEQEWKMVRTEAFKQWFGESMVVDENDEPLVLYHGSSKKFDKFDVSKVGASSGEKESTDFATLRPWYSCPSACYARPRASALG